VDAKRRVHRTNIYYFDQYTGQRLFGKFEYGIQDDASTFKTINGLVYDIHLGSLGGFWGRLLVCLSLFDFVGNGFSAHHRVCDMV